MDNTELHETLERCADAIREMVQKVSEVLQKFAERIGECVEEIDRRIEEAKRNLTRRRTTPMAVLAVIVITDRLSANKPPRECMHPT